MHVRSLLLVIDTPADVDRLLEAVLPLASAGSAHVAALHVTAPYTLRLRDVATFDLEAVDRDIRRRRDAAEALARRFAERCAALPVTTEWCHLDAADLASRAGTIVERARTADLVVTSRHGRAWTTWPTTNPGQLAAAVGRPLLTIPEAFTGPLQRDRVIIACNGSREAARAAFDALPLLRAAHQVTVVAIRAADAVSAPPPADHLARALGRHDVATETIVLECDLRADEGSELLRFAVRQKADLLVMGAYGHSRLAEVVLGGVTRHVVAAAELPLLLSH